MADQTSGSIDIAAPPGAVMAVISDVEQHPAWVDSMSSAEVLTAGASRPATVRMVLDPPVVKEVDATLPMIEMSRREAEKTIIDGALRGLERRVEG